MQVCFWMPRVQIWRSSCYFAISSILTPAQWSTRVYHRIDIMLHLSGCYGRSVNLRSYYVRRISLVHQSIEWMSCLYYRIMESIYCWIQTNHIISFTKFCLTSHADPHDTYLCRHKNNYLATRDSAFIIGTPEQAALILDSLLCWCRRLYVWIDWATTRSWWVRVWSSRDTRCSHILNTTSRYYTLPDCHRSDTQLAIDRHCSCIVSPGRLRLFPMRKYWRLRVHLLANLPLQILNRLIIWWWHRTCLDWLHTWRWLRISIIANKK